VGTPYDDRPATLRKLSELNEFQVVISGHPGVWKRDLGPEVFARLYREGELFQQQYREAIWRSKINLSFITHSNLDEFVHKSFEIAGCGGFLLAERSEGHLQRFKEDEEAVFFSSYDELVQKIRRYLPDEEARRRIAAAGMARAIRDGYHNDHQVSLIVDRAQSIINRLRTKSAV
jgi:spore maturation protein CgeB